MSYFIDQTVENKEQFDILLENTTTLYDIMDVARTNVNNKFDSFTTLGYVYPQITSSFQDALTKINSYTALKNTVETGTIIKTYAYYHNSSIFTVQPDNSTWVDASMYFDITRKILDSNFLIIIQFDYVATDINDQFLCKMRCDTEEGSGHVLHMIMSNETNRVTFVYKTQSQHADATIVNKRIRLMFNKSYGTGGLDIKNVDFMIYEIKN